MTDVGDVIESGTLVQRDRFTPEWATSQGLALVCERCGVPFDRTGRTRYVSEELRDLARAQGGREFPSACPRFLGRDEIWTCDGKRHSSLPGMMTATEVASVAFDAACARCHEVGAEIDALAGDHDGAPSAARATQLLRVAESKLIAAGVTPDAAAFADAHAAVIRAHVRLSLRVEAYRLGGWIDRFVADAAAVISAASSWFTAPKQRFRAGDVVEMLVGTCAGQRWVIAVYEADRDDAWIAGWPCTLVDNATTKLRLDRAASDEQHAEMIVGVAKMRGDHGDGDPRASALRSVLAAGGTP